MSKPTSRRKFVSLLGFVRFALLIGLLAILIGFGLFALSVNRAAPSISELDADGIVVLTGPGGGRLETGAELLKAKAAERLLISGVDKSVTPETIAEIIFVTDDMMACCVDLDFAADDTLGNARETAIWARAMGYEHLIVVTSDYHMPRAMLELNYATDGIRLTPYPVPDGRDANRFGVLSREYGKLLIVFMRQMGERTERSPKPNPDPGDVMREAQDPPKLTGPETDIETGGEQP